MNYFDLLPGELILIFISYVDIFNKKSDTSLTLSLNGLISLLIRYNQLYNNYINLINNGYINNFRTIKLIRTTLSIYKRNNKYIDIIELYQGQIRDSNIKYSFIGSLEFINRLSQINYNFVVHEGSKLYLIHYILNEGSFDSTNITLELIIFKDNKYYYMNYHSFSNGEFGYSEYIIIKYDNWKECINNIPYNTLKILYKQNNYDRIPDDNGRIDPKLIKC